MNRRVREEDDVPAASICKDLFADLGKILPLGRVSLELRRFDAADFSLASFSEVGLELPAEIARSVHKRRAEFFYGRVCARAALRRLGFFDCEVAIGARREPIWPAGVVGSISHGSGLAAAAVARSEHCAGLGIDIESLITDEVGANIAAQVARTDEIELLRAATACSGAKALTLIFSAKESFFKASFADVRLNRHHYSRYS